MRRRRLTQLYYSTVTTSNNLMEYKQRKHGIFEEIKLFVHNLWNDGSWLRALQQTSESPSGKSGEISSGGLTNLAMETSRFSSDFFRVGFSRSYGL